MKLRYRSARSVCQCAGLLALGLAQVSQVQAIAEMIVSFQERRAGDQKEPREVGGSVASKALCDVTGRGTSRVADLIAIFEILGNGRLGDNCIDSKFQFICELPTHEILIAPGDHVISEGIGRAEPRTSEP